MKFGIDFGTTNTAVSVMRSGAPEPLSFGQAGSAHPYVPSLYAVQTGNRDKEFYGAAAKVRIGDTSGNLAVYQNFKMLLGESASVAGKHWPNGALSPEQVTRKYIEHLVRQIKDEHRLTPKSVVVTVPEVWIAQSLMTKREHLIACFKEQGIPTVRVESEPIAAASYFLHCFKQQKKSAFHGHLLVCDCGGGTMDFCLVRVETGQDDKPRMTVLERAGNGMVGNNLGSAGVAFDQAVVERLFPGLQAQNAREFHKHAREFEDFKIASTADVTEALRQFRLDPDLVDGEVLFSVAGREVEAQLLAQVFDSLIRPGITQALQQLSQRLTGQDIDLQDPSRFRVLMVGGFSLFYPVQETIRRHFGNISSTDQRFEDLFTLQDRAFAIAKGAALIANELTEIVHTCPVNVGVLALLAGSSQYEYCRILQKGTQIAHYKNPHYERGQFQVLKPDDAVPIYLEAIPGNPFKYILQGQTLSTILPADTPPGTPLEIGFSVDDNLIFSLHVRDAANTSKIKTTTLGNLMARIPGLMVTR